MKLLSQVILAALVVWGSDTVYAQKKKLAITRHDGAEISYTHFFTTRFKSDRSDLLTSANSQVGGQDGNIRNEDVEVEITGEWRTREIVSDREESSEGRGEWKVTAKLFEADSRATVNGDKLGYEKYPFSFEQLKNREYTYEQHSTQGPSLMRPGFRVYQLREREDIVTDLSLIWASGISPTFPDHAVGAGDTWEGTQNLSFPFYALEATATEAQINVKSTYTVKKVKKGGRIFEIEEEREIEYLGWTETSSLSVMVKGTGKGKAKWEIDTEKGVVNKAEYQQYVGRPEVSIYGQERVLEEARAEYSMVYSRKLDKFKK